MVMKKPISVLCAAAVLLSSVISGSPLYSAQTVRAEEGIVEDEEPIQLAAPQNLRYEDGDIVWDEVEGAYGYYLRLYIAEGYGELCPYYENRVELDRFCYEHYLDLGEYTFDVCAFDEANVFGEFSNLITAEYVPTLDAPTNVKLSEDFDETVLWDEVEGADYYNIRIFNDDDDRTLNTWTRNDCNSNSFGYRYCVGESGNYWFSVQAMDKDYNVSECTEPILVSHTAQEMLEAPQNVRFDESGENVLWDEVEGADYYSVYVDNLSITDSSGSQFGFNIGGYTEEARFDNWKSLAAPYSNGEIAIYVYATSFDGRGSYASEYLYVTYKHELDESIDLPESIQAEEGYLKWDAVDNADVYWVNILMNGKILNYFDHYNVEAEYYNGTNVYIGNRYPADTYDIELYVVDKNNNYNSKTYSLTLDTPQDETVWVPKMFYKFDTLLWDFDRLRHEDTGFFWIRIKNAKNDTVVKLVNSWSEQFYGLSELPNGDYIIEVCAYEWKDKLGPWSEPLKISNHDGSLFDDENEVSTEVEVPPEIEETVPEEDRVVSITINPAFNMKHKDGDDVELDLSKIEIKANEIYDEEGLKRAEEALGKEIKGNSHYNLLDLTLLYDGEDFSNGYEGLVKVIIPIPTGHLDKNFSCYRMIEVDGEMVKQEIPGEREGDNYIIYLEHFSEYALVGHIHEYGEDWEYDGDNHWKECECGEKSEEEEHTFGDWEIIKEATEKEEGSQERSCEVCGYKDIEEIPTLPHTFGEEWKYDKDSHWKECECGEKSEEEEHTFGDWEIIKEATEKEEGSQERICEVCGYKDTEEIPTLPHSFSANWKYDENNHWKECDCGEKSEIAEHTYGEWTVTEEATETEKGLRERACEVCGYKQTEEIDLLPHTHVFDDMDYDEDGHWKICVGCGITSETEAHTYGDWTIIKEATETEKGSQERSCEICGYKQTEEIDLLPHTHKYGEEWKNDENSHWQICEGCIEESEKAEHAYGDWTVSKAATETEEGSRERSCEVCGYKQTEALPKLTPAAPTETEKPDESNPNTGVGAVDVSIIVLSACAAAAAFSVKRKKS